MKKYFIFSYTGIKGEDKYERIIYGDGHCILEDKTFINKKDLLVSLQKQDSNIKNICIINIMEVKEEEYNEWVR